MVQTQGGYPSLDLWLSAVTPNPDMPAIDITTPTNAVNVPMPPVTVTSQKIGEGICTT